MHLPYHLVEVSKDTLDMTRRTVPKTALLAVFLLSLLVGFGACKKKEKDLLLRLPISGQQDLVIREGDSPCKALTRYCKSIISESVNKDACFSQLHPIAIQQLTSVWDRARTKLKVDESFFIDCKQVKYNDPEAFTPGVSHSSGAAVNTRNTTGIVEEMLEYLEKATQRDKVALQTFNSRRNELKLTDYERIELYRRAILLLPNNLFVVDQFGLALMYIDQEGLARKLFAHAVSRGLWGHPMQRPVSKYVPGLTSKPWHDKRDYPFITILEAGYEDIRVELLANLRLRRNIFTEEGENLHVGGDWSELRVKSSGNGFTKYSEFFPKTLQHIRNCGEDFTSIKFSAIQPGTHIRTHTGPTNERLRIHLTLLHTGGARIRVGEDWHTWTEGEAIIFDDSWEHEVIHTGESLRAVLILDIWHPELPASERIVH